MYIKRPNHPIYASLLYATYSQIESLAYDGGFSSWRYTYPVGLTIPNRRFGFNSSTMKFILHTCKNLCYLCNLIMEVSISTSLTHQISPFLPLFYSRVFPHPSSVISPHLSSTFSQLFYFFLACFLLDVCSALLQNTVLTLLRNHPESLCFKNNNELIYMTITCLH